MRYPHFLEKNGTVGFAAPSYGCNREPYQTRFQKGLERLADLGHRVKLGPNCYAGCGVGISNTPEACGRELTEMYCEEDCDVLISCGGGELMCETIEHVDWERVKAAPAKWFMGYSDNTNFTFLLTTLCDTASLYGYNGPTFGGEPLHPSIMDHYRLLRGELCEVHNYDAFEKQEDSIASVENPCAIIHAVNPFDPTYFDANGERTDTWRAKGRLLGGCLDVLSGIRGTHFDRVREFCEQYREDGVLWFLESCELNPMSVRRVLWSMKHAGWFEHASGLLIGRPMLYDREDPGLDHIEAVRGIAKELSIPVAFGLDFGHLPPSMPIICGAVGTASGEGKRFRMEYTLR